MKLTNVILYTLAALSIAVPAQAAKNDSINTDYRRSSLCSFLISRTDQKLYGEIQDVYLDIPTPDQYNNHDLSIRILNVDKKGSYATDIDSWLTNNYVASRLVGRWFDRNILTGECDLDLVKSRGLYDATAFDKELAARSARGLAQLEDAGEELIGNTFVLVHEAHYIDKAQRSKNVATGLRILGSVAGAFLGSGISDLMDNVADMTETFKGFRVKFHTRLYQLVWDEETSTNFYANMYSQNADTVKMQAFENGRGSFKLKYIGDVESKGNLNSFMGINEDQPELMIRKACQRAIDDNVCDLQKAYDVFRVKSPILEILDNKTLTVAIGMKEGITMESEYEVLEPEEVNGKIKYNRIGTIVPVEHKIWDNRYMAKEEGAVGSELTATTFKVKSGKTPYEGLLVRQIK